MKHILKSINALILTFGLFFVGQTFAEAPDQVTNVQAQLQSDKSVILTWDEGNSVDDIIVGYTIYYGTNSVKTSDDFYTEDPIQTSANSEYTFENLEAGNTYYFAVTARDSIEQESGNYSLETSIEIPGEKPAEIVEPVVIEPTQPIETPTETVVEPETTTDPLQNSAPDTVAPAMATKVSTFPGENKTSVMWKKSTASDLATQKIYYRNINKSQWSTKEVSADAEFTDIETQSENTYLVKIISADEAGNKSETVEKSFSTTLAKSGPTTNLAIILAIVFFGLVLFTAKKRA